MSRERVAISANPAHWPTPEEIRAVTAQCWGAQSGLRVQLATVLHHTGNYLADRERMGEERIEPPTPLPARERDHPAPMRRTAFALKPHSPRLAQVADIPLIVRVSGAEAVALAGRFDLPRWARFVDGRATPSGIEAICVMALQEFLDRVLDEAPGTVTPAAGEAAP